jgi:membrane-associated phospholipid phosphatase
MSAAPPSHGPTDVTARACAWVSPPYLVFGVFGGALLALLVVHGKAPSFHHASVIFALSLMVAFTLFSFLTHGGWWRRGALARSLTLVRDWLPFVLCTSVYENLHDVTQLIRPDLVDGTLARIDEAVLGVQPTLYLQAIVRPGLTNYLAFAYTSYFFVPPILSGYLYVRGHRAEFRRFQLVLLVAFYGGFFAYISVPAIGPRYWLADRYTVPLAGALYDATSEATNSLQQVSRDCFPSLHTAISTLWLITFVRLRHVLPAPRILLPLVTILTLSLWFSTVYLRYHWAVDVVAGWVLAGLSDAIASRVAAHADTRLRCDAA